MSLFKSACRKLKDIFSYDPYNDAGEEPAYGFLDTFRARISNDKLIRTFNQEAPPGYLSGEQMRRRISPEHDTEKSTLSLDYKKLSALRAITELPEDEQRRIKGKAHKILISNST